MQDLRERLRLHQLAKLTPGDIDLLARAAGSDPEGNLFRIAMELANEGTKAPPATVVSFVPSPPQIGWN